MLEHLNFCIFIVFASAISYGLGYHHCNKKWEKTLWHSPKPNKPE